jgi:hypothetical protein
MAFYCVLIWHRPLLEEEDDPRVSGRCQKDATLGGRENWSSPAAMGKEKRVVIVVLLFLLFSLL